MSRLPRLHRPSPKDLALAVAFVATYVGVAAAGASFAQTLGISPWWLPAALTFVLFVRRGWRWFAVACLAELGNAVVVYHAVLGWDSPTVVLLRDTALGRLGYLAAALLATRVARIDPRLRRPRDVLGFVLTGVGVGAVLSALEGVLSSISTGYASADTFWPNLLEWWAGDAVAVVVLGSVLVMTPFARPRRPALGRARLAETAAQLALVGITPVAALHLAGHRSYLFLCFVPLLWVALRRGVLATAWTALAINVLTTYAVGHRPDVDVRLSDLQLFMGTLTVTALMLGAVVSQITELNHELEQRVEDRTRELAEANTLLTHQAGHDALTGLVNRGLFNDRLQNALDRRRRAPAPLALLLIDLDGFKLVNDTHGHAAGDAVLRAVADRLRATFRDEDTVARLGGDEFAVLVEVTPEWDLETVGRRVLEAVREPVDLGDGLTAGVGASVGAVLADGDAGAADLLLEADRR
ncbi:MAG TPA: diguanylate cyclase, partial [Kineosporiaceae bacterium]|nr:diguanylate cyclase [Kineosporiaceae bacterium]